MIIRSWQGVARPGSEEEYLRFLTTIMVPHIQALPGCLGIQVLNGVGASDRFVVQSRWADIDAIRRFAGPDAEHAVVPPEARALLADFEERAEHFEVVIDLGPEAPGADA